MTGSEYMVEHRNFENWSSTYRIEDLKEELSLLNSETQHSSKTLLSKVIPQTLPHWLGLGSSS